MHGAFTARRHRETVTDEISISIFVRGGSASTAYGHVSRRPRSDSLLAFCS